MTATEIEAGVVPEAPPRYVTAERLVSRYTLWGAGAGLIPVPVFDVAAVAGVQVKLVYELAKLYGVPFAETRAKSLIAALGGSVISYNLALGTQGTVGSLVKAIPVFGPLLGLTVMPAIASAATYAIGKVFIQHFESGGTLLDFEPERVREHFRREFERAKDGDKPHGAVTAGPVTDTVPATVRTDTVPASTDTVKPEPFKPAAGKPATP